MIRNLLLALFLLIFSTVVFSSLNQKSRFTKDRPLLLRERIEAQLPVGSFLRDYQRLPKVQPETYLILYAEKGYQKNDFDPRAPSCPATILGESISGKYRLALFRREKITDDLIIPNDYNDEQNNQHIPLELAYRNSRANTDLAKTCVYPNDKNPQCLELRQVKLLDLKDYTGDGQAYEFLLTTTAGGCGFYDRLAAGYDPQNDKPILYSDWLERFEPNSRGESSYLLQCGDHGNQTRVERKYKFSTGEKKFKQIWEKKTTC